MTDRIVLVHGLIGFGSGIEARLGLRPENYWTDIPSGLAAAGFDVHGTNLPHTSSIHERACALVEQVKSVAERYPGDPIHMIAHSMGGLDSRYALSTLGLPDTVKSLTTLGTPHAGTAVADFGDQFLWFEMAALRFLGCETGAYPDLTRAACQKFNEATPDVDGVRYFSVAGCKTPMSQPFALIATAVLLHDTEGEGANDGLVSVASAMRWGGGEVWVGCNHADLLGWPKPTGAGRSVAREYVRLAKRAAGIAG